MSFSSAQRWCAVAFSRVALVTILVGDAWVIAQTPAAAPPAPSAAPSVAPAPAPRSGSGVGDLLVAPTRIVLEGRVRSAEVSLINIGSGTATYRISFSQLRMTENGELKEIEKPEEGAPFADSLIRYSPREITLEPNVAQVVRMQLRLPASLPDGEYRSHLLFRAVPPENVAPERSIENSASETPATGFSVRLTPIYGVSIPVIVRHGAASATVSLADAGYRPGQGDEPATLECKLGRVGNASIYGNLTVKFVPASGPSRVVGVMNGVAVYTPNPFRIVRVPLQPAPGVILAHGRLHVEFSKAEANGERLAEAVVSLP
ncbi:MAG TPA: molecular chaperone [Thermoanaerobaculia bacterium]